MRTTPLVSVITVTFNSISTLRDTINSVLSQNYQQIEHVIIDGGSTDGTVALIQELEPLYSGRLKWASEPDDGIYDAMNKGIAIATGQVIGILNSDDLYAHEFAVAQVVHHLEAADADALYADLVFVDRQDTGVVKRTWTAGKGSYLWGWNPPHPTMYVSRELYARIGEYRRDYKISSDYDFMLRAFLLNATKTVYLNEVIVKMRQGGESTRGFLSNKRAFAEVQNSLRELGVRAPTLVNLLRVIRKIRQFIRR